MLQMEIAFNRNAVAIWEDATRKLADNHKQIAFIVNDKLLYAPLVVAAIPDGVGVMSLPDATRERLETIIQEIEKEMPK